MATHSSQPDGGDKNDLKIRTCPFCFPQALRNKHKKPIVAVITWQRSDIAALEIRYADALYRWLVFR